MSDLSDAIVARGPLIGTLLSNVTAPGAEALSRTGLDWVLVDLEHSVMTLADAQAIVQALAPGCLSLLRIEEASAVAVKRALDTGCTGLVVPQVNSPELAREVVRAAKFAPVGERSIGLGRALGYGRNVAAGIGGENARTSIVVQIEHRFGVDQVEEIAAVEGVDGLFVGPFDLSASFGVPGDVAHPAVRSAIARVAAAAGQAGKVAGIFVGDETGARRAIDQGFTLVTVGSDMTLLAQRCADLRALVRPGPADRNRN